MGTHVLLVGTKKNNWISQIYKEKQQDLMTILRGKEMKREVKKKYQLCDTDDYRR